MQELPTSVYRVADVRAFDARMIATTGTSGLTLMNRAGQAALEALQRHWPVARHLCVVCGGGNNGGDGYVIARLARAAGLEVTVLAVVAPASLRGDAALAHGDFAAAGGQATPFAVERLANAEVIVDALLGTGLNREVAPGFAEVIDAVNAAPAPVLAVDVPSGLDAGTGHALPRAVRADVTVTFVGLKTGLFIGEAQDHCGRLEFSDLGLPPEIYAGVTPALRRLEPGLIARALPRRRRISHKGTHGRVLVIGGGPGMPGAVRLSAEAALRTGAGLVVVATHPANVVSVSARPELICHGVETVAELQALLASADVVVVGPGLGRSDWATRLVETAWLAALPTVCDADALNLLAERPRRYDRWILTPHPGEAARLLGTDSGEVQRDRPAAVLALQSRYGGVAVLKGAGTLVADGGVPWLCDRGNPGMAVAGMGDVLTGVIGGVLAQTRDLSQAAAAGVLIHALAGDAAAAAGERGLLAGDLLPQLRACVNPAC